MLMESVSMATILILEDDLDLAEQWINTLEKQGHMTVHATRGNIAKSIVNTQSVDLVIADIFIKEGEDFVADGGLSLLGHLQVNRASRHAKRTPVIIVTGSSMKVGLGIEVLDTARDLGAVETLRKPIDMEELLAAVGRHLPESTA